MKFLYLIISVVLIGTGCKKIVDSYSEPNNVYDLLNNLKYEPQIFTVTAGTNQSIVGSKGTKINFTTTSFRNSTGAYITNGNIKIALIETPKAKDMLLNGVSTLTSSAQLLQSGGSVNIKATQNDQTVYPGEYSIDFKQDAPSSDSMELFVQNEPNGIVTWNAVDPITNPNSSASGTTVDSGLYYYGISVIGNFNWINCDYFYNDPSPKTDISIDINGPQFKYGELLVFMILPDINSNTFMSYKNDNTPTELYLGPSYELPIGMKADFVVLGMNNNKNYYGELKNQTITNNFAQNITVTETSLNQIKAKVNAL